MSFFRFLSRRRTGRRDVSEQVQVAIPIKKGYILCKVILLDATDCSLDVKVCIV